MRGTYIKRRTPVGGKPPALSTAAELILGAIAGALAQIFTIPVSVIATRQQVSGSKHKHPQVSNSDAAKEERIDEEEADSFWSIGKQIVREEGVTGLWLGIKPGLVLTVNPAITYGAYERVKSIMLLAREKAATSSSPASGKLSPGANFLVGALSKTLATVVTYPYIMAKVRIQARSTDDEDDNENEGTLPLHTKKEHTNPGAIPLLTKVYRKEGLTGWYQVCISDVYIHSGSNYLQGMSAQITKAVLSQALLFMSKDQFEHWALLIMAFLYKVKRT